MRKKILYVLLTLAFLVTIVTNQSLPCAEAAPVEVTGQTVYVGGTPIGIKLKSKGLVVIGRNDVLTENGLVNTIENSKLAKGDMIVAVEGNPVQTAQEFTDLVNRAEYQGKELQVTIMRGKRELDTTINPALDMVTKEYRVGLWVKEDTLGIGTLTYVENESLRFGCLGHSVIDSDTKELVPITGGEAYECTITGVVKGMRGKAGELKGAFINTSNPIGVINDNNMFGIFGKMQEVVRNELYPHPVEVLSNHSIKPGKASIVTTVYGDTPKEYQIEIVKVNNRQRAGDKSMVIRITDPTLLDATGGIVQGMSGSPILQDGKLCGAITHVFINDPTRGYAVFAEWMLNTAKDQQT